MLLNMRVCWWPYAVSADALVGAVWMIGVSLTRRSAPLLNIDGIVIGELKPHLPDTRSRIRVHV